MQGLVPGSPSFSSMCLQLIEQYYPELPKLLNDNPYHSIIFEMCSAYNHIVTRYNFQNVNGYLFPIVDINPQGLPSWNFFGYQPILEKHIKWSYKAQLTSDSMIDIQAYEQSKQTFISILTSNEQIFGFNPEGLVLYVASKTGDEKYVYPLAKIKRPEYLDKHGMTSLEVGSATDICLIQKKVCEGTDDDLSNLPSYEIRLPHIQNFKKYLKDQSIILHNILPSLCLSLQTTKKEYASVLNGSGLGTWIKRIFFNIFDKKQDFLSVSELSLPEIYEFLCDQLLTLNTKSGVEGGKTLLECLQVHPYWYDPSVRYESKPLSEKSSMTVPGIAVFDFDGTLVEHKAGNNDINWFNTMESLDDNNIFFYPSMVNIFKAYQQAGWTTAIVTGREQKLRDRIEQLLVRSGIKSKFYTLSS